MATATTTDIVTKLFDYNATRSLIEAAVVEYKNSSPQVYAYLSDLYERLDEDTSSVQLAEIIYLQRLVEDGYWEQANQAANRLYHFLDKLGKDTTGHLGF